MRTRWSICLSFLLLAAAPMEGTGPGDTRRQDVTLRTAQRPAGPVRVAPNASWPGPNPPDFTPPGGTPPGNETPDDDSGAGVSDPVPNCIGEPADHPQVDYPERRVFLESQSWWGERVKGHVPKHGETEHLHIGACFPLQQVVSGTVRMDFRVVAHNVPAASLIELTRFQDGGNHKLYTEKIIWNRIVGRDEIDVVEWAENVQIDTTLFQDGLREARPHTSLIRPNGAEIHVSGGWCWNIQNTRGTADDAEPRPFCTRGVTMGRGWYDCFEYKTAEVRGWRYPYNGIPSGQTYTIKVSGRDGAGGTRDVTGHFARLNPNFHAHDHGTILFDHRGEHYNEPLTIEGGVLTPGIHALFLMSAEDGTCSVRDGEMSGGIRIPILVKDETGL